MQDGWTLADGEFLPRPMMLVLDDDDEGLDEDWDDEEDLDEDWDDEDDDEWDEWEEEFEDDDDDSLGRRSGPPEWN